MRVSFFFLFPFQQKPSPCPFGTFMPIAFPDLHKAVVLKHQKSIPASFFVTTREKKLSMSRTTYFTRFSLPQINLMHIVKWNVAVASRWFELICGTKRFDQPQSCPFFACRVHPLSDDRVQQWESWRIVFLGWSSRQSEHGPPSSFL
jgi:hypothetical protein